VLHLARHAEEFDVLGRSGQSLLFFDGAFQNVHLERFFLAGAVFGEKLEILGFQVFKNLRLICVQGFWSMTGIFQKARK
jgi:hypothetical protein